MHAKMMVLIAAGAVAVVVVIAVVAILSRDEVQQRYDAMAVGMEDHCKLYTDGTRCRDFADCYRDGIEVAFPREVLQAVIAGEKGEADIPPGIDEAVRELERSCGEKVGLSIEG